MEASTLTHASSRTGILGRRSPLLKLQGDARLVALIRSGHEHAFEVLFERYHSRLLAFCRHMLRSTEDAEDVLQEVFVKAHAAMLADERPINVRPWLYRIARNRSLNHLRRPVPEGQDSMDVMVGEGGVTTAERVQQREDFRCLVADVQDLPETQRTALLLRELDALSYEEIAEAMDTTIPAVKSLLVRARMSLAEASHSRQLTCGEVRLELAEAAEGLRKASGPVRHHVKRCDQCRDFRSQLSSNTKALAALAPIGPLALVYKTLLAKFGWGGSGTAATGSAASGSGIAGGTAVAGAGGGAAAAGGGAAAAGGGVAVAGAGAGGAAGLGGAAVGGAGAGAFSGVAGAAGLTGAIGAKAAATAATAALLTAGAVEVKHIYSGTPTTPAKSVATATQPAHPATTGVTSDGATIKVDAAAGTVEVSYSPAAVAEEVGAPAADPAATEPIVSTDVPATPADTAETPEAPADTAPTGETYTPGTAVVGPAEGGTGAAEGETGGDVIVVEPGGSTATGSPPPPAPTPASQGGGPETSPQAPPLTPPVATPPATTPAPSLGEETPPADPSPTPEG